MNRFTPLFDRLGHLWRWGDKWLVHIWLGIPLAAAFTGWLGGGLDQYQDFGEYALKAPRIERKGLIKSTDLRLRNQVLVTGKERLTVKCGLPHNNACIKHITPINVSVKLIKYRDYYIIMDMIDSEGKHRVIEKQRVDSIMQAIPSYKSNTTADSVSLMIIMSFALAIPLMILSPFARAINRRSITKKRANDGGQ